MDAAATRFSGTPLSENEGGRRPRLLLRGYAVGDGEVLAAFGAATGKHLAAVGCRHALAEAVLVNSLAVGRLECSFHRCISLFFGKDRPAGGVSAWPANRSAKLHISDQLCKRRVKFRLFSSRKQPIRTPTAWSASGLRMVIKLVSPIPQVPLQPPTCRLASPPLQSPHWSHRMWRPSMPWICLR